MTIDAVNFKYGAQTLKSENVVGIEGYVWDRLLFGSITNLEELYAEREACPVSEISLKD